MWVGTLVPACKEFKVSNTFSNLIVAQLIASLLEMAQAYHEAVVSGSEVDVDPSVIRFIGEMEQEGDDTIAGVMAGYRGIYQRALEGALLDYKASSDAYWEMILEKDSSWILF